MNPEQLPLLPAPHTPEALARVVRLLDADAGWLTAQTLLLTLGLPRNETYRRWLRLVASHSSGQIAGGQLGYKLVRCMTHDEYNHYRNWMKSQADTMLARILASDKIFYARQPLNP